MKILAFIFALTLFFLSAKPCTEGHNFEDQNIEDISVNHNHQEDSDDSCRITCICNCYGYLIYGQQQNDILLKIVESVTNEPIASVHITNLSNNEIFISDLEGKVIINEPGSYQISCLGYKTQMVNITNEGFMVIQLYPEPTLLNEVIVGTHLIPLKLKKSTSAVSVVSSDDINFYNSTDFAPVLNNVPGIYMQTGALNTNRITIRGIGSRNPYGTSKIRAYYQEIPLTNGNGETNIEDFELNTISRIEVIRGASSSIYGAGLGGTIHIIPRKSLFKQSEISTELIAGSYGLFKFSIDGSYGGLKNGYRVVYSNTQSDGYRDNNNYDRKTLTLLSNHFPSSKDRISTIVSLVDLKAFIPSSLDYDTYQDSPSSAAFTWASAKGYEDNKRNILGLSWRHEFSNALNLSSSIFGSFIDSYEPRPFNILDEDTFSIGVRSRLNGTNQMFNSKIDWTAGLELYGDWQDYKTFDNLYEEYPTGTGSVKGDLISSFEEKRNYINVFSEFNYHFSKNTLLSFGLNYNNTRYVLSDEVISDTNSDQSGTYSFKGIVSPKIGFSYLFPKNHSLFANIGHGFSPPTLEETLLPNGQINPKIIPETGWNFEIGMRGQAFDNRLRYDLSFYRLAVKNLLVARRTSEDQFIGINAGSTEHDGLEMSLNYNWIKSKSTRLNTYHSLALNNYKFKEFIDDENDFSGNELTGVPSKVLSTRVEINTEMGLFANINYQYVGSMPITDDNLVHSNSYDLFNLKIGYQKNLLKKVVLNSFIGINNLFNTHYASQVLINAPAFGNNSPRFFYPSTPINYYTGFNLKYSF